MDASGYRGATRIRDYWAGGERFDALDDMIAAFQRQMAEREAREVARLAALRERRRTAKRRLLRACHGHDRPVSTRRTRRRGAR